MVNSNAPIGVLDAGFGGYTVVKELQALMPHENIVYCGDGKNHPYGNRSREDIIHLTGQCLNFLAEKKVKAVAIACNTISALIDSYRDDFNFPIFSVVEAGSDAILAAGPEKVIVFSTVFTAESGCYAKCVGEKSSDIEVIAQGSPGLARLIEEGEFHQEKINQELERTLGAALQAHPEVNTMAFGCTHFPIAQSNIEKGYPQLTNIINPAYSQAVAVRKYLKEQNLQKTEGMGTFSVYTTSDCAIYRRMAEVLELTVPDIVEQISAPQTLG